MSDLKLGSPITGEAARDAIHVAIAPVVAGERLSPGQHVGFIGETVGVSKQPIGVVDPYLQGAIFKGDRFWLFLYPNTVTSLRHQWEHPAFDEKSLAVNAAKVRIEACAKDLDNLTYETLMDHAKYYLATGDYIVEGGRFEGLGISETFWDDYEIVTGTKVPQEKRYSFFSCTC